MRQSDPRYHCATERAEAFARVRVISFLLRCCACEGEVVFLPAARRRDGICRIEFLFIYTTSQLVRDVHVLRVCALECVRRNMHRAGLVVYILYTFCLYLCAKRKKAEKRFEVARHIFVVVVVVDVYG